MMKRFFLVLCAVLLAVSFASCGGKESSSQPEGSSEPKSASQPESASQSEPSSQIVSGPPRPTEEPRDIAADFALNFTEPFSSPEELEVDRFCLWKIYYEDPDVTDDAGILWVSPQRLKEEVELRFGLTDHQFQSPEQENVYPRYVEEKDAIAFMPVGHGNWYSAVLVGMEEDRDYQYYIFDIFDAMITDGHEEPTLERTLVYKFRPVETVDGAPFLQAVSAVAQEYYAPQPDAGSEWDPDPGTGELLPGPSDLQRKQVVDMADYLERTLDPWDYSEIFRFFGPDGCGIQISTPFPDTVKTVVDAYPGEPVSVEYLNEQFSKGQLDQAKADLEQFLATHPDIQLWDWRRILLFGGYQIELKENSDALTDFIESYSIPGVYQVKVYSEEPPAHPD